MVWVTACYSPSPPSGVPCSSNDQCPNGQDCNLDTGICNGPPIEGDVDAPTVIPPDASGTCDPTEVFVDGACTIPIAVEVAPYAVSAPDCDTQDPSNSRSVGIDAGNRIYAAFRCGATNAVFVATSHDGGVTAAAPLPIPIADANHIAVRGGPRKVAYVGVSGGEGVAIAVTTNGGLTWNSQVLTTAVPDGNFGVSVVAAGDSVCVAAEIGSSIRVWRNTARGSGTFDSVDVPMNPVYGEMILDPATGDVWAVGDDPNLHLRKSVDGGATFGGESNPTGQYHYSEWAIGDATVFVTGADENTFTRIPTSNPGMSTLVTANLPAAGPRGRVIAAAPDNSIYIATQPVGGGALEVLRFAPGASISTSRALGTGTGPSLVVGPGATLPFVFTESASTKIQLGVFRY